MAKKSAIVIGIAAAIVAVSMAYGAIANPGGGDEKSISGVWNIRISGPEFEDLPTIGSEIGVLGVGTYEIGFVPMGDSPGILNLTIMNKDGYEIFNEEFFLEKSLIDTGISKYYTWEYIGEKFVTVSERDNYEIIINREGNLLGSVSITIEKLDRSI
tara:strand:- start:221 stop:691 length:471 start_codon:yes stop_codon:yes gene_type:complete